ncbi:MAG TPA: hypothetical protein VK254_00790 [Candidatus Bathyarchaeia archaeon]|nr:hypothetical protein [Candidatus Bathyarchaeia archaeon]
MRKKTLIFFASALIGILAVSFFAVKSYAVGNQGNQGMMGGGRMGRIMNMSDQDFEKWVEAHRLMREGKYSEAREMMRELGMGDCPMMSRGDNVGDGDSNDGGMMRGNGCEMMRENCGDGMMGGGMMRNN